MSIKGITLLFIGLLWPVFATAQVVIVPPATHEYTFDNGLADNAGGPALQSFGGTLQNGLYVFGANQGLLLANPLLSTSTYTLEFFFKFDSAAGYQKIVDVKNRTSDSGLYSLGSTLNFYPVTSGPSDDFVAGNFVHVVLTRLGSTQAVTAYINGAERFTFADVNGLGEISGANKELNFFIDDLANGGEAAAGSVDFIRVFDEALTSNQVLALFQNGAPPAVPEPSTWTLLSVGLSLVFVGWYRRRAAGRG